MDWKNRTKGKEEGKSLKTSKCLKMSDCFYFESSHHTFFIIIYGNNQEVGNNSPKQCFNKIIARLVLPTV
jgi:hypothetical protein